MTPADWREAIDAFSTLAREVKALRERVALIDQTLLADLAGLPERVARLEHESEADQSSIDDLRARLSWLEAKVGKYGPPPDGQRLERYEAAQPQSPERKTKLEYEAGVKLDASPFPPQYRDPAPRPTREEPTAGRARSHAEVYREGRSAGIEAAADVADDIATALYSRNEGARAHTARVIVEDIRALKEETE